MDTIEKVYLAGFFDSDGCVNIGRYQCASGSTVHSLKVIFTQNDEAFLQDLCRWLGAGTIHPQTRGAYDLVLGPIPGTALLRELSPFLYIKRKEAELAIEFRVETVWREGVKLSKAVIQKRDEYKEALSALKSSRQPVLPCPVPPGPLTDAECAYLAGFIDGDGCIAITSHDKDSCSTPVYDLWLVIAQKGADSFLQYWQQRVGLGTVFSKKGQWRLASKAAEELLRQVMPFLRLKKGQAEVALQFRATFSGQQGGPGRRLGGHESHTLPHVIAERERCRQVIAGMNGHK